MSICDKIRTEAEVAAELKCSVAKIRKLRAAGRLAYIPGRPVLILDFDFLKLQREEAEEAYARWEGRKKRKRAAKPPKPPADPDAAMKFRLTLLQFRMRWAAEKAPSTKQIRG